MISRPPRRFTAAFWLGGIAVTAAALLGRAAWLNSQAGEAPAGAAKERGNGASGLVLAGFGPAGSSAANRSAPRGDANPDNSPTPNSGTGLANSGNPADGGDPTAAPASPVKIAANSGTRATDPGTSAAPSTRASAESEPNDPRASRVSHPSKPSDIKFGRDVRPILSDRCFKCHGPDAATRAAKLRLDERESAIADLGGYSAIAPGDPEGSELLKRVSSHDPEEVMPPVKSGKKPITADEREILRRWIEAGAVYEPHWAFVPPHQVTPPQVKDAAWARNPIDQFILARLEHEGLAPAPEASPEILVRRVFLDLTGLPPTPEETDAYLADKSPDAYERLVDLLMTQDPYRTRTAERLATPWLDTARYADTCGIHMDAGRQMWLWRDWVLDAFRNNLPFDRFVTEQLAGDLIPEASEAQKIASGFNRNHVTTDEGGAIAEEYLIEYAAERTATTGSVFMGLTMGCARCHDHKFDPVTQSDFYSMFAFFDSIEEPGLYSQLPDPQRAFEPFIVVPTAEQKSAKDMLTASLAALTADLEKPDPAEDAQREAFFADLPAKAGVTWASATVTAASSTGGSTMTVKEDGSILASGANPEKDDYQIELRTDATDLRVISLEAIADPSMPEMRIGRAPNGNAVMTGIEAEAISVADNSKHTPIQFRWAWGDVEQNNGDFRAINIIRPTGTDGWAVGAHMRPGERMAMVMTDEPFGYPGGTIVKVTLKFQSRYAQHSFGRVRLAMGTIGSEGETLLAPAEGSWYLAGPFTAGPGEDPYAKAFGPEEGATLDFTRNFGAGNQYWRYAPTLMDGKLNNDLPGGPSVTYVAKRILSPTARTLDVSIGSDDGFQLYVNGKEAAKNKIDRGLMPDQDKATIQLVPGENTIVLKIINTGGPGGMYWKEVGEQGKLSGDLVMALAPPTAASGERLKAASVAWKTAFSERYRTLSATIGETKAKIDGLDAAAPRTMVMKELAMPRQTYVLKRGDYDKPDKERPVVRAVPKSLGKLPEGAPANRLGLAQWLTSEEDPLLARVAVNRLWEQLFGAGIVRTTEDFGYQGDWPSHPELLDWLAVEFRHRHWDTRAMLRMLITSSTYRQSSRVRAEVTAVDPENRLLGYFPRKRLSAEQIRDQALYVSGLLVEKLGGPSVKPYQPEGLWQEVAMPQSNTRIYERGKGEDLWRRSLYTYWKRASPPPSLMTFDAPTRESCTIRRISTNTPLQALVLWNDVQFVEASRVLAQRTLQQPGDDASRLTSMFRRCTARTPTAEELDAVTRTLAAFRERYAAAPDDANKLLMVGEAPRVEGLAPTELAAWTLVANALLNLDTTITKG